jgi:hypothetical protein
MELGGPTNAFANTFTNTNTFTSTFTNTGLEDLQQGSGAGPTTNTGTDTIVGTGTNANTIGEHNGLLSAVTVTHSYDPARAIYETLTGATTWNWSDQTPSTQAF